MSGFSDRIAKNKIYLWYTLLFCITALIVFMIFIQLNKGFIWQDDGFKQHYSILYDFNQIMRNSFKEGFQTFSWDMGLGLDVIRSIFLLHFRRSFCLYKFIVSYGNFGNYV